MHRTQFQIFLEKTKYETVGEGEEKKYIISGPFAMADKPNLNRRIYPKNVLNKAIEAIRSKVASKRIRVGFDHPEYHSSKLSMAAAILTELTDVQDDGFAYYTAQIIDTRCGKDLKVILDAGSLVGVSTRGWGHSSYKEVPGLEGEYEVLHDDYTLDSFDFVDDPSVERTEEMMQLENNKGSNQMKTFADLEKAYPEIIAEHEKANQDKLTELQEAIKAAELKLTEQTEKLNKIVSGLKENFSDMFSVVEESKLVEAKAAELAEVKEVLAEVVSEKEELAAKVSTLESAAGKLEKENAIAKIKADDPDFFTYKALVEKFDICSSVEDVQSVYESNKKLIEELKADKTPATPKTEAKAPADTQDKQYEADLRQKNAHRLSAGIPPYTLEEYKARFVTK